MKRIAVASGDGVTVCDHLARSAAYFVFDGEERSVRRRGSEACGNHATFVEMLAGCDAVICGGIGQGAAVSLAANGIAPVVSPAAAGMPIEDAYRAYCEGRLATSNERVCLCSH